MGAAAQLHRRLALVCSGLTSVATESRVFAANLAVLLHIERMPLWWLVLGFLLVLAEVVSRGIRESMWLNVLCTLVEASGWRRRSPCSAPSPSLLLLLVFAVVNRALVILKRREGEPAGYFEIPIIIPALGALVCLVLVVVRVATED
jgi:hypothetical protein